jgi:hypothetical protein
MGMPRPLLALLLLGACTGSLFAQDLEGIQIHGFATQGFLFSSANNYLTMKSSDGSLAWTDGAVSIIDPLSPSLRVGIQLHMYQLGDLGSANIQVDWASGDYKINDHLGFRGGKVKTALGLFNDSQDVDALNLWILLPQSMYPTDNKSFLLSHLGGEVYGGIGLGNRGGALQYSGYAGQSNLDLNGGYVKAAAESGLVFTSPPGGKVFGGDVRWTAPLRGFTLGSSLHSLAQDGTAPAGSEHISRFITTTEYAQLERGRVYFAGEYRREPLTAVLTIGQAVIPIPYDQREWYFMGSYRLTERFQLGSYYSHYVNLKLNTALPESYSRDWVVSGRWDFNSYFYGKLEGHFLHGTGQGYFQSTNPGGLKPSSNMLAAKIGFSF